MTVPVGFRALGARGYFEAEAQVVTLPDAIALLCNAAEYAQTIGLSELLLNGLALTGYQQPTILDRYQFISKLANIAAGRMRIAIVLPEQVLDPQRFGTLVAANRGLDANVFTDEAAAVAWLDNVAGCCCEYAG